VGCPGQYPRKRHPGRHAKWWSRPPEMISQDSTPSKSRRSQSCHRILRMRCDCGPLPTPARNTRQTPTPGSQLQTDCDAPPRTPPGEGLHCQGQRSGEMTCGNHWGTSQWIIRCVIFEVYMIVCKFYVCVRACVSVCVCAMSCLVYLRSERLHIQYS
jgi:hypothetical protein